MKATKQDSEPVTLVKVTDLDADGDKDDGSSNSTFVPELSKSNGGVEVDAAMDTDGDNLKNGTQKTVLDMTDFTPEVTFQPSNGNKRKNIVNGMGDKENTFDDKDNGVSPVSDDVIEIEDDGKKETGCCGRKRRPKVPMVGAFELFQFASPMDKLFMLIGTLGACGQGVTIPINIVFFGDVIDVFVAYDFRNTTNLLTNSTDNYDLIDEMTPYIFGFVCVGVASFICSFLAVSCWQLAAERQVNCMRKKFFHAVMRQDIGWFDVHEAGEISSRFSEDVSKISDGMGDKMAVFLQWATTWLAAYIMAFTRDWRLCLAVIFFSPGLIFVGSAIVKVLRNLSAKEFKAYAKAGSVAEQSFRAIRTVQAFQGQEKEIGRYEENLVSAVKVASKKGIALGMAGSFFWFLLFIMFAVVMWLGTVLIQQVGVEPGKILPVFFGVMIGSISLGNAFNNLESLSVARGAATKVFEIIQLVPEIDVGSTAGLKPDKLSGHIEFHNVQFSYPARPDVKVLKDLSLEIKPGEHVALVGASGCGKSTTVQLLQRFYDAQAGSVTIDGHNIKDLNLKWLRNQIGVVSQEPVLFDTSIEENIRFGKMDATKQEIEQAAKEANAHDFIQQLPEGYQTNVGERGAQLSGGQKQRISIARALVRNPQILLLDEATSALDHESEAVVQSALEKAEIGRTTITIAHRLSTIRNADKILTISEGEVVEIGTHQSLMDKKGLYYQLVQIQTRLDKESEIAILESSISLLSLRSDSSEKGQGDIADVEIVEEDEQTEDEVLSGLLTASFKRSVSRLSEKEKEKTLVARESTAIKKPKIKSKGKKNSDAQIEEIPEVSFAQIMKYNSPEWKLILVGCLSSVIAGAIHPAFSVLLSEYIKIFSIEDHDEQMEKTHVLAGSILGVAVVSFIGRLSQGYSFSRSGALLTSRLRKLTFTSIINQDMDYFDRPENQVGAIASKLSGDASLVHGATGSKLGQVLEALSTLCCAVTIAFVFGWKLALVTLTFMPLMVVAGIVQGRVIAGASRKERSQLQQAGKLCSELVDNIRTVASLGREDYFTGQFDNLIDQTKKPLMKMSLLFGITYGIANCLIFFAYAASFYYGTILVRDKEMEYYDVFRVFSAIIFGGTMIGRQSSFGIDYTKAKLAAARIIHLIHRKPKVDIRDAQGVEMVSFQGSITLTDAVYHYPTRPNIAVLDGLNLVVKPGQTVALVGASGCGKSTTVQLCERFYDVDGGSLMVDGVDIRKVNLRWYRQQLGIVSQEPTLFDCSIAENIAYGDTSRVVPMDEIIEAARSANVHSFIASLPQGYATNVGDKGTQLSGGQKQRIAIARALIRNPKVLLLDEATSALDSESEKVVQDALDRASEKRTCIVIAHRLSTIQNADKIAVVSKGKIVESGTHTQLMTIKGAYYRLHKAQNRPGKGNS